MVTPATLFAICENKLLLALINARSPSLWDVLEKYRRQNICWGQAPFIEKGCFPRLLKNVHRFQVYWAVSSFFKNIEGKLYCSTTCILPFFNSWYNWEAVTVEVSVLGVVLVSEWCGSVQRNKTVFPMLVRHKTLQKSHLWILVASVRS